VLASALAVLAAIVAAERIVRVVAAVTGGTRWGDVTVGAALLTVPAALAVALWRVGRGRGWSALLSWWVLILPFAVAVGLSTTSHQMVIDASLQAFEDACTLGLETGLLVGWIVAFAIGLAAWAWWLVPVIKGIAERPGEG
jgi:hypothetical protein